MTEGKIKCGMLFSRFFIWTTLCDIIFFFSIILDADATSVVQRVALRTDDIPLGEQTVAQAICLI